MTKNIFLLLSLLCGLWFTGNASWIHAKAMLAQVLLETAWSATASESQQVKPWPWADTWPVARLSAPHLGINHIVLAGASGASLAFGPGHLFTSAAPGEKGNVIISGHRDTHFAFLEQLRAGDELILETQPGEHVRYTVSTMLVVDIKQSPFIPTTDNDQLLLTTCYPFDAIQSGGPLRYVVIADADPLVLI